MSLLITNQVVLDPNNTVIEPSGWRVAVASETEAEFVGLAFNGADPPYAREKFPKSLRMKLNSPSRC
ncbi:hypothetical protein I41_23870 [Lacipirellula limnantheis]|uniref:Uncharacterized protein n=1 Tax=Lacipirellula limnantheis TaxID=2528024 RepID=A0A517TXU4_9BACT|nr:hypothetical protein I41_23870 [Lacipirellula limnantheis]